MSILPPPGPIAMPGDRVAPGDGSPFAALLGALDGPAAEGEAVAAATDSDEAGGRALRAFTEVPPPGPEPGRTCDQPAASDPLLVHALGAATQHAAMVAPTATHRMAEEVRAAFAAPRAEDLSAARPASAAGPGQGRAMAGDRATAKPVQTETISLAAAVAAGADAVHRPEESPPADPIPSKAGDAAQSLVHPLPKLESPAPQRIEATMAAGALPPIPWGGANAPPQVPQDGMPPRATTATPIQQVAQLAVAISAGGEDEDRISVALDPVELGRVEISIEHQGGSAQVRVVAERPETLALLQRDHRELDRLLGQSGIGEEGRSLSFGLSSDGGGTAGGSGHGPRRRGGAPVLIQPGTEPETRPILGLIDLAV